MKHKVFWEGPQFVVYSLANVNRCLCLALIKTGRVDLSLLSPIPSEIDVDVEENEVVELKKRLRPRPAENTQFVIRHSWPPSFRPPGNALWIHIQPWEYGSLPKAWEYPFREQVDEIWVYSHYNKECYVRSGIPRDRIEVIPLGVAPARFRPGIDPITLNTVRTFKFLFVGGTIYRKGIDLLLDAYLATFNSKDDVCLVIQDFGTDSWYKGQTLQEVITELQANSGKPEILYRQEPTPDRQLPSLYASCDCFVHPHRGEGFGLPIAEAMACGLPVIVPNHGACLDFCDDSVAFLVPATEFKIDNRLLGSMETVAEPWLYKVDKGALGESMRTVYENRERAKEMGNRASRKIREQFTWANSAKAVLRRFDVLSCLAPRQAQATSSTGESNDTMTLRQQAAVLLSKGDYHQARYLYEKLCELEPNDSHHPNSLGICLLNVGEIQEAERQLMKAVALDPRNATLRCNLGHVLLRTGRTNAGIEHLITALRLDPNNPNVLNMLRQVLELLRTRKKEMLSAGRQGDQQKLKAISQQIDEIESKISRS